MSSWMLFPNNPVLSALVLFLILLPFLYAARVPVHGLLRTVIRGLSQPLRLAARWLARAAQEIRRRNEVVLLAHGQGEVTQELAREFERVAAIVRRDLEGYPALQRRLLDELTLIEDDYKKCGEVPPPPPEWTKAVKTIAEIKQTGDGLAHKILDDIARSIDGIYEKVLADYRKSSKDRHRILEGFQPFWRSLEQTLLKVDKNLTGLTESAMKIDAQMEKYEQILARSENVVHSLTASASVQFAISLVVFLIAIGGAFVNFWLIAKPMSAMVGGGEYLAGGFEASQVAALVIILLETTAGLFLMESLRITHLFPRIHHMPDRRRRLVLWAACTFLVVLAGVEVALAVMRDIIINADIELKRGLGDAAAASAPLADDWANKIPVAGQMILGFTLPFLLAFVGIPFEYFVASARTVFGALLAALVHALALLCRILSNAARHLATALMLIYDVVIFLPVLIERMVRSSRASSAAGHIDPDSRQGGFRKVG